MTVKTNYQVNFLNGSPRGKGSNSRLLIEYFNTGYEQVQKEKVSEHYLKGMSTEEQRRIFSESDSLIVVFPLYTDAMPGSVKVFFENLAQLAGSNPNLRLGFILHSGFPEGHHSVYLAQYLEKLTRRLGCHYLGTVIKGGTEGIQIMPDWFKKKLMSRFNELGKHFAYTGGFDKKIMNELRNPYQMSVSQLAFFKFMKFIKVGDFYWNSQLKKNGAYENRWARPYSSSLH